MLAPIYTTCGNPDGLTEITVVKFNLFTEAYNDVALSHLVVEQQPHNLVGIFLLTLPT